MQKIGMNRWTNACNSLERDALDTSPPVDLDNKLFEGEIKKTMKLCYFNKLKQFMVRLYRNNLFLNKNAEKWKNGDSDKCWTCNKDHETCFHLFLSCEKTTDIFLFYAELRLKQDISTTTAL